MRRTKIGEQLADRFFAGRTFGQLRRAERSAQREFSSAHHAPAFAQFVFVSRHDSMWKKWRECQIALRRQYRYAKPMKTVCASNKPSATHSSNFTETSASMIPADANHLELFDPMIQHEPSEGKIHNRLRTKNKRAFAELAFRFSSTEESIEWWNYFFVHQNMRSRPVRFSYERGIQSSRRSNCGEKRSTCSSRVVPKGGPSVSGIR